MGESHDFPSVSTPETDADALAALATHAVGSGVHAIAGVTGLQAALDGKAALADHEYTVYLSSLTGAQPQVFTEIPATDGHYVFAVTLKQNAGSGHTRVRFSFRVASGAIHDCTGIQEGPSDMNSYVRILVVSGNLSFKFNLGGAAAWFHIQSTVAISASDLTGWTSAAVADWSGTTPSWIHYAGGQQYYVDYLFANSAVATPSVGRSIYGPFAPWMTTHADSPTVNSDASNNFRVGDLWLEQDASKLWYCVSNGNGAASWIGLTAASAIKLDDLATPDDNTDLNASSTRHGLLPKLSNVVTEFLTGTGTWATPSTGNFFACNVHKNATQSVAASTEAAITWQVDEYDPDGIHDTGSNTSRFTIPTGGTGVWLFGMIALCNYSVTRPTVRLAVNGTGVTAYRKMQAPPANMNGPQPYITLVNVTQGDYVEFWWDTNDAGAANSIYGGNNGDANEGYNSIAFCIGPFGGA